jgi:hypothetical protein
VKLNLGCGDDVREGYVNVDFRKTHPSVVEMDLSKFPWGFESDSADEILMLDFLEHFPYASTPFILLECHRVIKESGEVIIQVPDAKHLSHALSQSGTYLCNSCGTRMYGLEDDRWLNHCPGCGQSDDDISMAAMRRLYGGQDYPGNYHQTCFTGEMLLRIARPCGLYWQRYLEHEHQYKNWNFKAVFTKGDIW